MKYDNLAFVISIAGPASAAPYLTGRATPDGKSEPLTTPVDSSPKYTCNIGRPVNKNMCRDLLERFVTDADHMQHQGMPRRRDVYLAADKKNPILTYSANAGDRHFIRLSRRGAPEAEGQKKVDSADIHSPLQTPDWPSMSKEWPNLAKEWPDLGKGWPKGFSSPKNSPGLDDNTFATPFGDSNHEEASAAAMDGCTLEMSVKIEPDALKKNGNDGLQASQDAFMKSFFGMDGLVDQVKSGTSQLLQNCESGGVVKLDDGVVVSLSPPQAMFPLQFSPDIPEFGPLGPYGNPSPIGHGQSHDKPSPVEHGQSHDKPTANGAGTSDSDTEYGWDLDHDHQAPEYSGNHWSSDDEDEFEKGQPSENEAPSRAQPDAPIAHEPESAQPPTLSRSGPSPVEQQAPEAAYEDATPEATPEASHDYAAHADAKPDEDVTDNEAAAEGHASPESPAADAGIPEKMQADHDYAAHADAKPDEDVTDNEAAAEDHASPETPAADAGIPEKLQTGHNATPMDIRPAAQPVPVAR